MGENDTDTGTLAVKNQQIQSQQRQQTTINRFADYFVICGLDLEDGLEPDRFAGTYLHKFEYTYM